MYYSLIWLGVVIVLAVIEAFTVGLTVIWFAVGGVFALICAAFGGPVWLQIIIFIIISLICLILIRPVAKKNLEKKKAATNADRIIGTQAEVTEDINNTSGKGAVLAGGLTWTARSENGELIPSGSLVKILRIEGVKVFVEPVGGIDN